MINLDRRESLYKPGDIVTIRQRIFDRSMYQCAYVDEMTEYTDQKAMIIRVRNAFNQRDLSIESKAYLISIDGQKYTWSAEMFQETVQNPQNPYWKYINLRIFDQEMIDWLLAHCDGVNDNFKLITIANRQLLDVIDYTNGTYDILNKLDQGKDLRAQLRLFQYYLHNHGL